MLRKLWVLGWALLRLAKPVMDELLRRPLRVIWRCARRGVRCSFALALSDIERRTPRALYVDTSNDRATSDRSIRLHRRRQRSKENIASIDKQQGNGQILPAAVLTLTVAMKRCHEVMPLLTWHMGDGKMSREKTAGPALQS